MVATLEIRRAVPEDCPAFARSMIAAAVDGELNLEPDVTVGRAEDAFREGCADPERDILIVQSKGRLVGGLVGHPEGRGDVRSFGMWVDASARRQGAGRSLVRAALASRPGRTFEILVWPDNEPAVRLYASFGFAPVRLLGKRLRRDGTRIGVLQMRLPSS